MWPLGDHCCYNTCKMAEAQIARLSKELYQDHHTLNPELFGDGDDDLFRFILYCWIIKHLLIAAIMKYTIVTIIIMLLLLLLLLLQS